MKRIVITCDGTWCAADRSRPTNVIRLAQAVEPVGPDGVVQVVHHLEGLGTGRRAGRIGQGLDRMLGGLLGLGFMAGVVDAYRFLVLNYVPGDQIYFFGFSRGAYTARSLVGLIRNCGILRPDALGRLGGALALYRARGSHAHPNAEAARAFRARFAADGEEVRGLAYLGVWDTVGALGIPAHLWGAALANRGLAFHDASLTGALASARHAVAIDERRRSFPPALWDNLDRLNREAGSERYRQVWFPGNHGSVGGGGGSTLLSNDTLHWIAEGAVAAGMAVSPEAMDRWARERDCRAPFAGTGGLAHWLVGNGYRDRAGPERGEDLSEAAWWRWHLEPGYRPAALRHALGQLAETREGSPELGGCLRSVSGINV